MWGDVGRSHLDAVGGRAQPAQLQADNLDSGDAGGSGGRCGELGEESGQH